MEPLLFAIQQRMDYEEAVLTEEEMYVYVYTYVYIYVCLVGWLRTLSLRSTA